MPQQLPITNNKNDARDALKEMRDELQGDFDNLQHLTPSEDFQSPAFSNPEQRGKAFAEYYSKFNNLQPVEMNFENAVMLTQEMGQIVLATIDASLENSAAHGPRHIQDQSQRCGYILHGSKQKCEDAIRAEIARGDNSDNKSEVGKKALKVMETSQKAFSGTLEVLALLHPTSAPRNFSGNTR